MIVLVTWAGLCAVWNTFGALQIAFDMRPLGPGTTYAAAAFSLVMAAAFIVTARRKPYIFVFLAVLSTVLASLTIWNAFTLRSPFWPSDFWRFIAVSLNALGIGGSILALADATRYLVSRVSHN